MYRKARYIIAGDKGVTVEFGNEVSEEVNNRVRRMEFALEKAKLPGIIEFYSTFRSLFVLYNPLELKLKKLIYELKRLGENMAIVPPPRSRTFEIPVVYGGKYGMDLDEIAKFLKLTPEEVIQIHSSREYLVYMNGHVGGTAFIKMPDQLASLPRKKTPALWSPAGSVTFAGGLGVAFKVLDGPSGWHRIGTSPLKQWFPEKNPPLLILAGDKIRYKPISEEEYKEIKGMVEEGRYQVKILEGGEESLK